MGNLPIILLACTNQAEDGKHAKEAVMEIESISKLLHPLVKQESGYVLQARYGSRRYFTDVLTQKKYKQNVTLIHLMGDEGEEDLLRFRSRSGESQLTATELAEALSSFPALKLIILSGNNHPDFTEILVRSGIAPVLAVPSAQRLTLQVFYDALLDGKSVEGAYKTMAETYPQVFAANANIYNPATQGWSWRPDQTRPVGLWLHQGQGDALSYQLRNPLLIPATEQRIKPQLLEQKKDNTPSPKSESEILPPARKPKPATRPQTQPVAEEPISGKSPEPPAEQTPLRPRPARRPRPQGPEMGRSPVRAQREEEAKGKRKSRLIGWGLGLIALVAGGMFSWPVVRNYLPFLGNNRSECLFEDDGRYHVLILPFSSDPNCANEETEKRKSLHRQLQSLAAQGYRVSAKFWNLKPCEHSANGLNLIADNCGADLVLWAYPADDPLTGEPTLTFQLIQQDPSQRNPFAQSDTLRIPFYDAEGRTLVRPIENIIFWSLGERHVKAKRFAEAIGTFRHIIAEEESQQALVWTRLAQTYALAGEYEEARRLYDQLIDSYPRKSEFHYERANLLTKLGVYDSALLDLGKVLEAQPDNTNALISRGVLYQEQGNFLQAIADFNLVLEQNPQFSPVYCSRAEVYIELGENSKALADYNSALRVSPDYVGALYGRGKLKHQMGRRQEALSDIRRALTLEPDYTDALLFQGDILLAEKEYNQALLAYTQVLDQYKSARAYLKRGHVYRLLQEYGEALDDLGNALRLDPTLAEAWRERGLAQSGVGQFPQAFEDLNRAIRLAPMDAESYYVRADLFNRLNQDEEALKDYQKAISIRPKDGVAYYKQGRLFLQQGNHLQALEAINQAIRVDGRQAEAYVARGEVYQALDNMPQAVADWEYAMRIDPNQADAYFFRGAYRMKNGQTISAQADLDRAIQLGTSKYEAYLFRADMYSERNSFDRALELYSEALRLNPDQPTVYYTRAQYYLRAQQYSRALADFNQGIRLKPPTDQMVYLSRAKAYAHLKDPDYNNALIDLSKVIRAYPNSAEAYGARGIIYQRMGRTLKGEDDINQALRLEPGSAIPYLYQGILLELQGKYPEAIAAYTQAIADDQGFAEAYAHRGNLLSILKRYEVGLEDLNHALSLDPTLADAYLHRGDLYRRTANYPFAIRDYTSALQYAPENDEAYYKRGRIHALNESFEEAIADIKRSLEINSEEGLRYAQLAKIYARQRQAELFFEYLEMALDRGYPAEELTSDPGYYGYRNDRRFENLVNMYGVE